MKVQWAMTRCGFQRNAVMETVIVMLVTKPGLQALETRIHLEKSVSNWLYSELHRDVSKLIILSNDGSKI